MTDTHETAVKCSAGRERAICCSPRAIDNLRERHGNAWVYYWHEFSDIVAVVADALGIDPHALDDHVQDRGWEYHDRGIERAIVQGAYALLHPEDNDPDGTIIVETKP